MARDANDVGVGALNYFYDLPARGGTMLFAPYNMVNGTKIILCPLSIPTIPRGRYK